MIRLLWGSGQAQATPVHLITVTMLEKEISVLDGYNFTFRLFQMTMAMAGGLSQQNFRFSTTHAWLFLSS